MKKVFLFSLFTILILCTFTACGSAKKREKVDSDIKNFSYNYGSYSSGYYNYSILSIGDTVRFVARGYNGVEIDADIDIDKSYLEELNKIINDNKIYEWDGFSKRDDDVLDGYSFSLKIEYENGEIITASGYMKYPDNYNDCHEKLSSFLKTIK